MYVNLRLINKAVQLSLRKRPVSVRRWGYVLLFSALYALMWLVVAFGRMLDHVFFPAFRRQPVNAPVFIIAPPRSGTTYLQKLMSLDDARFAHVKLYQTIFPSIFYQRCFDLLGWVDRHMGCPLHRLTGWAEKKFFAGWDGVHPLRFDEPEEDDGFFVYSFVSEAIFLLFPYIDELWEAGFADALPKEERRKLMRYYRSCLQRHLYANGPDKVLLSKATQSSGAVDSLWEAFPDARFITIIRHPYQAVASHVSVFYPFWHNHSPELAKDSRASKDYARLAVRWYQHLFHFRSKVDAAQYYCMEYRDLTRDPGSALKSLYRHFGWTMGDAFQSSLDRAIQDNRTFKSGHRYTLEEFGLSKEWIQKELGTVMDHYSLGR